MSLKIYYLDDEPDLLEMFVDLFSAPDRDIITFSDPKTAIETIQKSPPDILFIDFRLPNITGDQIALMLDPKIPKVLITGDMQVKCVYRFDAIFDKPYREAQVEEMITKLTRKELKKVV